MKKYCFFNGKITDVKKAHIPLDDIGILRGYSVFDYFRTYNGIPFRLNDYFERFKNSAKVFSLNLPISQNELNDIVSKLLKKNKLKDASFRMVLTGGSSTNAMQREGNENFYIIVQDVPKEPIDHTIHGGLVTLQYMRLMPLQKTTSYIKAVDTQDAMKKLDANEILYHFNDLVLECSTSNIFIIKGGKIYTPKDNVLKGITRKVILEIAKVKKITAIEKNIKMKDLFNADEVFITSSGKSRILPITRIDKKKVNKGKVGDITKLLIDEFNLYTSSYKGD